jgi:hypothetical protein
MSDIDYKIRVRGPWDWRGFSTARLEVSVGQEYHEGEKLSATMRFVKENFNRAVIILGDAPQRFNIAFTENISLEQAFGKSIKAGDDWIERNRERIAGIELTRWEDWRKRPEYAIARAQFGHVYTQNQKFRECMHDAIKGVSERRCVAKKDFPRFFALSEQFLLEESAVFAVAYNELRGISLYPGDFLEMWSMFVGKDIPGVPEGAKYANCGRISFEKRKLQYA